MRRMDFILIRTIENRMSGISLLGAVLVVAFLNVVGGMLPGQMAGDVQLAYWLATLLVGVFAYATLEQP